MAENIQDDPKNLSPLCIYLLAHWKRFFGTPCISILTLLQGQKRFFGTPCTIFKIYEEAAFIGNNCVPGREPIYSTWCLVLSSLPPWGLDSLYIGIDELQLCLKQPALLFIKILNTWLLLLVAVTKIWNGQSQLDFRFNNPLFYLKTHKCYVPCIGIHFHLN